MDVEIGELTSTIRAVDKNAILSPTTMAHIVQAAIRAVREDHAHARRVKAEKKVSGGVSHELAEDGD